ncbi:hypothetical protein [Bdellovibrio sp. HCB209]|uniref:hypothetical protein n=1 Tax=Bdellovibrio sp. HCB209 TaxID=3394354 RepID=UPI0039B3E312
MAGALLQFAGLASAEAQQSAPIVDDKYSLKADREAMDKLRENIPAEKRAENDEKAFMDQMMTDITKNPSEVRSKFSSIMSKKRDAFSKDMTKTREAFTKKQSEERNQFTTGQTKSRETFAKEKGHTSQERTDFYSKLDAERKEFYSKQKESRDSFEDETKTKRKDFDDYVRGKTDEFNQKHREFTQRYHDNKKNLELQKKQAAEKKRNLEKDLDKEYEAIKAKPATPLGTE